MSYLFFKMPWQFTKQELRSENLAYSTLCCEFMVSFVNSANSNISLLSTLYGISWQISNMLKYQWWNAIRPLTGQDMPLYFQKYGVPKLLENWHMKMAKLSALRNGHLYPQEISLVFIAVTFRVDPRATLRLQRLSQLIIIMVIIIIIFIIWERRCETYFTGM